MRCSSCAFKLTSRACGQHNHRKTESLHNAILVDLELAWQMEICAGIEEQLCFPNRILLPAGIILDVVSTPDNAGFFLADSEELTSVRFVSCRWATIMHQQKLLEFLLTSLLGAALFVEGSVPTTKLMIEEFGHCTREVGG